MRTGRAEPSRLFFISLDDRYLESFNFFYKNKENYQNIILKLK